MAQVPKWAVFFSALPLECPFPFFSAHHFLQFSPLFCKHPQPLFRRDVMGALCLRIPRIGQQQSLENVKRLLQSKPRGGFWALPNLSAVPLLWGKRQAGV